MNVQQLSDLLASVQDKTMPVMVMVQNHLKPGMFAFAEACEGETGISQLGGMEGSETDEMTVFLVLPHGAGIPEEDIDKGEIPELN